MDRNACRHCLVNELCTSLVVVFRARRSGARAGAIVPDQNGQQVRASCRKQLLEKLAQRMKQDGPRGNTFEVPLPRGELVTLACMPFED